MSKFYGFQNGDWVIFQSKNIISRLIRWCCDSLTNHGEPIIHDKWGQKPLDPLDGWWCSDAKPFRLKVRRLTDEIDKAKAGKYNLIVVRQKIVDEMTWNKKSFLFCSHLNEVRPFYNILAYPRLMWNMFWLHKWQKKHEKMARARADVKSLYDVAQKIRKFVIALEQSTYCTQILYKMYLRCGYNLFKEKYGVDFCTPYEQERMIRDGLMDFVCGWCDGKESRQLFDEILAKKD